MELNGKVAIVTGGGRGIGRAIAKRFARAGACVTLVQRDAAAGAATRDEIILQGGRAIAVCADVSCRSDMERAVALTMDQFGALHILVNNAAKTGGNGHLLEMTQEEWDRTLSVNLTGAFICSQLAAREMSRQHAGSIVNVSSSNGRVPQPECAAYAVAKGGLELLTRALAVDLAPYGIRVNTLAPGPVQSRDPDGTAARATQNTLLGRSALPEEIAEVALFLASDASSFVTGERIGADGGMLVNAYSIYGADAVRNAHSLDAVNRMRRDG